MIIHEHFVFLSPFPVLFSPICCPYSQKRKNIAVEWLIIMIILIPMFGGITQGLKILLKNYILIQFHNFKLCSETNLFDIFIGGIFFVGGDRGGGVE